MSEKISQSYFSLYSWSFLWITMNDRDCAPFNNFIKATKKNTLCGKTLDGNYSIQTVFFCWENEDVNNFMFEAFLFSASSLKKIKRVKFAYFSFFFFLPPPHFWSSIAACTMKSREFNKITSSEKLCKFFVCSFTRLPAFRWRQKKNEEKFNEGWKLTQANCKTTRKVMKFTSLNWSFSSKLRFKLCKLCCEKPLQLILDIILTTF